MKDYLEKKVRGDLISQRVDFLKQNILNPVIRSTLLFNNAMLLHDETMLIPECARVFRLVSVSQTMEDCTLETL